ncbi:MAG: LysM peptidoglycan-binding domain-containing M23 family metallopeptidase [Deltaproteobacteria bacterium]|nr:LysM peptidoglycan-binding domain-containing M23 family metallopeptidase [Deltaproteobacteria bacterium]
MRNLFKRKLTLFVIGTVALQLLLLMALMYETSSPPLKTTSLTPEEIEHENEAIFEVAETSEVEAEPKASLKESEPVIKAVSLAKEPDPKLPDYLEYKVKRGDTFSVIWNKLGAPTLGSTKAYNALKKLELSAHYVRAGEILQIRQSNDKDIIELRKTLTPAKTAVIKGDVEAGYKAEVETLNLIERDRPVFLTIKSSFFEAAVDKNVPHAIIDRFVDLFSGRVAFQKDIQPGDEFSLIYRERRLEDGTFVEPGPILAASLKNRDEFMVAVRHIGKDSKVRYFDEDGKSLERAFLRYPLNFTRISSVFSTSRFHPVLKRSRAHNGVDFAAPTGTPIRSVADGVVTLAGWNGGGGKTIKIQHNSRYSTAYLHLSKINKDVVKGGRVKRGQVIGAVGTTGLSTGPHLHFSFYDRGRYVDPLKVKLPRLLEGKPATIPEGYLQAAMQTLEQYHLMRQMVSAPGSDGVG